MRSGVYRITNKLDGKIYIGSASYLENRINVHKCRLRKHNHHNKHLQAAWDKYGAESFQFDVLEYCSIDQLKDIELKWILSTDCTNREVGYNKCIDVRSRRGVKSGPLSEEHKAKIAEAARGRKIPNRKSRIVSEETKAKIGAANAGKQSPRKGKKLPESHRLAIEESWQLRKGNV